MEKVKSSAARTDLTKLLNRLAKGDVDKIAIEVNGEAIAVLTTEEPNYEIPAIKLFTEEARDDWASLLEAVAIRNARFFFVMKGSGEKIYLRRHSKYRHAASQRWIEHVSTHRAERKEPPTIEDLLGGLDSMNLKLDEFEIQFDQMKAMYRLLFAKVERKGDLFATPENGINSALNANALGRYEVD